MQKCIYVVLCVREARETHAQTYAHIKIHIHTHRRKRKRGRQDILDESAAAAVECTERLNSVTDERRTFAVLCRTAKAREACHIWTRKRERETERISEIERRRQREMQI